MDDDPELAALRKRKLAELMGLADAPAAPPAEAAPATPVDVTDATLPALLAKHPLVVVDCWAPWCGPCRIVEPVIKALASEMAGEAVFAKLNVDENPQTARAFDVRSIPTLMIFRNGRLVDAMVGAQPKPAIAAAVRRHSPRRASPGPPRRIP
ncbi:MAG TPA: thioredoxin [Candidatus Thermoplasmatota archaeon]|nr:thioredoxin [Candidatus Thermoplasmatota archaeon]